MQQLADYLTTLYSIPRIKKIISKRNEVHLEMKSTDAKKEQMVVKITSHTVHNSTEHGTDYLCSVNAEVTDGLTSHLQIYIFFHL
jgi:hypothetical protein